MPLDSDAIVRLFLALYFSGIAIFYLKRLLFKQPPIKRIFPGEVFSSHWLGHIAFRVFRSAILLVCVARVPFPQLDHYLLICPAINIPVVNFSGIFLLTAAFGLVLRAHFDLGDGWRSGVDPEGPEDIVTTRLYARSRNPIFIGVITAQVGFVLALPSVFSLVCLVFGFAAIRNQVRLEEKHLFERGANLYQEYFKRVPRWL